MSLFNFPWLRKFFRRNMRPMRIEEAGRWKTRLSVLYAILAWNGFGVVCYAVFTGKGDWAKYHGLVSEDEAKLTPAQQFARTLGVKNASVLRVSGRDVKRYEIKEEQSQTEQK